MARVDRTLRLTAQREHFRALAQTDALTGLPNFRSFHARLDEEVRRADPYAPALACVMGDLARLKPINHNPRHAARDPAILAPADARPDERPGTPFPSRPARAEFA